MTHVNDASEWAKCLLTVLFARVRLILLVPFLCGACMAVACSVLPPIYSGGFSILIKAPEVDKATLGLNMNIMFRPGLIMENIIADEVYVLKSRGLYRNIAQAIEDKEALETGYQRFALSQGMLTYAAGLRQVAKDMLSFLKKDDKNDKADALNADPLDALASRIRQMSIVKPIKGTDILEVSVKHHHPQLMRDVLDVYAKEYFKLRETVWFSQNSQAFFQERTETYLSQWKKLLNELIAFKKEFDLIDPVQEHLRLQEQLVANSAEILRLETMLSEREGQEITLAALSAKEAASFVLENAVEDRLLSELKTRMGEVTAERSKLLRNFSEESSAVLKLDYQLKQMYAEYKRLMMICLKNEITHIKTRIKTLSSAIKKNQGRLLELNRHEHQIKILEEKIELYREQYLKFKEKVIEVDVQDNLRKAATVTVMIVSPPFVSPRPIWPRKSIFTLISMILGLGLTVFYVFFMNLIKPAFVLPAEATRELNLPVLAVFPYERGKKARSVMAFRPQAHK